MKQLTCGSLFSGIGGIDLGLERAGFKIKWQVERDEYCRQILAKHFPDADRSVTDVNRFWVTRLPAVDFVAAGVPCQPSSRAGKQLFSEDDRWLWDRTIGILRHLRPRWVLLENPTGLLDGPFGSILGQLAEIGLDAEWFCLRAAEFGADHVRDRAFILAYTPSVGQQGPWALGHEVYPTPGEFREATDVVDAFQRQALPFVCGRHDGFPNGLDQDAMTALGNACLPQIAEWIGRRILEAEAVLNQEKGIL